jgi:hypothetical protein
MSPDSKLQSPAAASPKTGFRFWALIVAAFVTILLTGIYMS